MVSEEVEVEIPFHDVDVLCVAWHGHYARYCELARTALVRKIGIDWPALKEMNIATPVVHFSCNYRSPLLYGERYTVRATLAEPFSPKIVLDYLFVSSKEGTEQARARTEQVYIDLKTHEVQFVVPDEVQVALKRSLDQRIDTEGVLRLGPPQAIWRNS